MKNWLCVSCQLKKMYALNNHIGNIYYTDSIWGEKIMIEIYENLYIGNQNDFESLESKNNYYIVQACKEPYHRNALRYTGRGAPKDHPEYFVARRGNRLICNLVDSPDPSFIPDIIISEALNFIDDHLKECHKVLVHCNQGMSRSAVIGLLYLKEIGIINGSFCDAEKHFLSIYPLYNPGHGMREYANNNWDTNFLRENQ